MDYRVLILKPHIVNEVNPDSVLWKAQIDCPKDYESVEVIQLNELIEKNNRRIILEWEKLIDSVGLKFDLKFDHKYCREYSVIDINHFPFCVQLFCCDISVANYSVEVHEAEILNFLTLLNLKKNGSINPVALLHRLSEAREKTIHLKLPIISGLFFILEKLIDHCIDYEVDIDYGVVERSV